MRAPAELVETIRASIAPFADLLPHDAEYLRALDADFERWQADGFGVPDFLDSLVAFQPQLDRVDGLRHVVVFPMVTQNGSPDRHVEAVLIEVVWPRVRRRPRGRRVLECDVRAHPVPRLHRRAMTRTRPCCSPRRSRCARSRTSPGVRSSPTVKPRASAGSSARPRRSRSSTCSADAQKLIDDQATTERAFVMWDLIHDRTHMRGDLPFDPFMIKQRMPYFLYSLEELRCDLTAFREATKLIRAEDTDEVTREHAKLVQYTVIFDRIFRFPITGSRERNYDGLGGQLLFAWMHQHHVLHWTDTQLTIDWDEVPDVVVALSDEINDLYWRSIDRPKTAHWLAAYDLVSATPGAEPCVEVGRPRPAAGWSAEGADRRRAGRRIPALDVLRGPAEEDGRHRRIDGRDHRPRSAASIARSPPYGGGRARRRPVSVGRWMR